VADSEDADAKTPARKGWLGAGLIVSILILLLGLAAIVVAINRPQAKAEPRENPPTPISFECSACRRKLKVKPEWAGKQVKCKCGAQVRAPAAGS
jgi:hypothetical protein